MTRAWFSAADLAALALPGLSGAKRKINERAEAERWALRADIDGNPLARPRTGRGGGLDYHISLLPPAARLELVRRGLAAPEGRTDTSVTTLPATNSGQIWAWYDHQPAKVKAEAETRASAVDGVERLEAAGLTRSAAVATIAAQTGKSTATIWGWLALIAGCAGHDRLPNLAPRRKGGGAEAEIDEDLWTIFKSDWLRPEKPTFSSCYYRLQAIAAQRGIELPHLKTLQRKIEREVDGRVIALRRDGADALRKLLPPQKRSVADLHAMELVNIDGHKWDVFVRFPDGRIARPMMIAIQDVFSRKFLSWRIGESESAIETRLCFADLFRDWGIPNGCLLDNGRAFASKWITGGAKTRFRFKIREDEPLGLLTQLNIQNHWATPYRGQSKPIERGFRDFCDAIAKHPAFAGAYTGNTPLAKPENYGEKAVDLDLFKAVVGAGIAAHNARTGRRTEMARGGSFDQAFDASYKVSPIRKASPEQLRLALLTAERVRANRTTGALEIAGNRYWCAGLSAVAGQLITVRFDPDNLHSEVHAYAADGAFLATVPLLEATGFQDIAAAKSRAVQEAEHRKATRRALELEGLLNAADLAAVMPDYVDELDRPEATVIRPVRMRGNAAVKLAPDQQHQAGNSIDFMDRFAAGEARLRVVRNEPD